MRKPSYKTLGRAAQNDCDKLIVLMRADHQPTAYKHEGRAVHALRSQRCLAGWRFDDADRVAHDVVRCSLNLVGAIRPSLEDAQGIALPNAADTCITCGNTLYDNQTAFCSPRCGQQHQTFRESLFAAEARAQMKCLICGTPLDAKLSTRRYCSNRCHLIAQNKTTDLRNCILCGAEFRRYTAPGKPLPRFCGQPCATRWMHRQRGVGPRRLQAGSAETTTGGHWDEVAEAAYQAKRAERYRTYQREYQRQLRAARRAAAAADAGPGISST